ncbi:hypothetical protein EDC50_3099 [Vulcaniibacterium tengchongense]|uniref:Uncharacterized protein n=1 Tax=Vulcaniibacterium tengchongense TaxID=1273429 RepID=A0A3N4VC22_9GAMM|nr:hypothetical protein EDC50_3099 [Vulcaniibacterium tengchongense]
MRAAPAGFPAIARTPSRCPQPAVHGPRSGAGSPVLGREAAIVVLRMEDAWPVPPSFAPHSTRRLLFVTRPSPRRCTPARHEPAGRRRSRGRSPRRARTYGACRCSRCRPAPPRPPQPRAPVPGTPRPPRALLRCPRRIPRRRKPTHPPRRSARIRRLLSGDAGRGCGGRRGRRCRRGSPGPLRCPRAGSEDQADTSQDRPAHTDLHARTIEGHISSCESSYSEPMRRWRRVRRPDDVLPTGAGPPDRRLARGGPWRPSCRASRAGVYRPRSYALRARSNPTMRISTSIRS